MNQDSLSNFNTFFIQEKKLLQTRSLFENEIFEKELDGVNVEKEKDRLLEIVDSENKLHSQLVHAFDKISFDDLKANKEFLYKLVENSIQEKEWTEILILIWLLQEQKFDNSDSIKLCSIIESLLLENELFDMLNEGKIEYSSGVFIEDLFKVIANRKPKHPRKSSHQQYYDKYN